jgi:hypothetical protein
VFPYFIKFFRKNIIYKAAILLDLLLVLSDAKINMNVQKAELYNLIDFLPENSTIVVKKFIEFKIKEQNDAIIKAFMEAPEVDEPLSDEDLADIAEARADIKAGYGVPWEEVKRDLGL